MPDSPTLKVQLNLPQSVIIDLDWVAGKLWISRSQAAELLLKWAITFANDTTGHLQPEWGEDERPPILAEQQRILDDLARRIPSGKEPAGEG